MTRSSKIWVLYLFYSFFKLLTLEDFAQLFGVQSDRTYLSIEILVTSLIYLHCGVLISCVGFTFIPSGMNKKRQLFIAGFQRKQRQQHSCY